MRRIDNSPRHPRIAGKLRTNFSRNNPTGAAAARWALTTEGGTPSTMTNEVERLGFAPPKAFSLGGLRSGSTGD
jgi:hypothetical protein